MDTEILRKAGLNEAQAKGYVALIEHGALSAPALAEAIGESRTNGYAVADKLVSLGLAGKDSQGKHTYSAAHPSAVEALAEKRRKIVARDEQTVKNGMNTLLDFFYTYSEKPGVRYLEGKNGLAKIYDDIIATGETLHIVRTPQEKKFFGKELLHNFIDKRIKLGIKLKALTPFRESANKDPAKDKRELMEREFFPEELYTAPVEVDVYGSKVGFISFGEDLAGVIIDNQHIADAMRQLLDLAKTGARQEFNDRPELVEWLKRERAALEARSGSER